MFESNTQVVIKLSVIVMPLYNPTHPVASMRVFLAVLLLLAHEGTYAKPKPKPKAEPKPKPFNNVFLPMVNLNNNPFSLE